MPKDMRWKNGRNFELYIADVFRREGFDVCVATLSKGQWDLVATRIHDGRIEKVYYGVMMQCKTRQSRAKEPEYTDDHKDDGRNL